MANTNNTRRVRAVKRTARRSDRQAAARQIRRGDYDVMASGSSMRRTDVGHVLDDDGAADVTGSAMSRGWQVVSDE